jgi:hypothetical protein
LPGEFTGTHAEATAWAKEQGGELPSRIDGIVLFEAAKKGEYQRDWYWLAPQRADVPTMPGPDFGYGDQYWGDVSDRYRARAVRRAPIQ